MRTILIFMIRGYQLLASPLLPPCCRFLPTCSEYSRQAIAMHGSLKGLLLTLGRLSRCHPFCAGGYDPVPEIWPAKPLAGTTTRCHSAQDGSTPATLNTHTT